MREAVATFVGFWEAQRRYVRRGSPRTLAAPWGAAMGLWEGQRSDAACVSAAQRIAHGFVRCPCRIPSSTACCL
eukprot:3323243-Pyramimonas_sp.AAC.1